MKIKQIKKQNTNYKIILEDNEEIIIYDDVIINNNLLYKKDIDEELKQKLLKENEYYETYNKVLKYIKTKLRSINEIKKYMNKQNIDTNTQEKIIKKLEQTKMIDDNIYVKAYIHDKISFTNDGPNKIKKDLEKENIDKNIIEEELNKIDKEELNNKLEKLIIKKLNNNQKYSENIIKQKLTFYFTNLGYDKEDIQNIIENNIIKNDNIIEKEYIKLYNKLKNKYENEKLNYIIKQKLYQKGFSIEEINKIKQDN